MGVPPPTDSIELVINWTLNNVMLSYTPEPLPVIAILFMPCWAKSSKRLQAMDYEDFVRHEIMLPIDINEHARRTHTFARYLSRRSNLL